MRLVLPFASLILFLAPHHLPGVEEEEGGASEPDSVRTVTITSESFSAIYPAVWFAPTDAAVTPLTERSETPPEAKYRIWIEPNDPEIQPLPDVQAGDGPIGFARIGDSEEAFRDHVPGALPDLQRRLRGRDLESLPAVFLYVDQGISYLMMVEHLDTEAQELTFSWRRVGPADNEDSGETE